MNWLKKIFQKSKKVDIYTLDSELEDAIENGNVKKAKKLIEKGANVNRFYSKSLPWRHGCKSFDHPIIFLALETNHTYDKKVINGRTAIAKMLIENGADVNAKDERYERSPIMIASFNGNLKIVQFLIERGAKVTDSDNELDSAVSLALEYGYTKIAKLLIENGASIPYKIEVSYNSFNCQYLNENYEEFIKLAINNGTDIEDIHIDQGTLLIFAAKNNRIQFSKFLIKNGADINETDQDGQTALSIAKKENHLEIAKLLGTDPTFENDDFIRIKVGDIHGTIRDYKKRLIQIKSFSSLVDKSSMQNLLDLMMYDGRGEISIHSAIAISVREDFALISELIKSKYNEVPVQSEGGYPPQTGQGVFPRIRLLYPYVFKKDHGTIRKLLDGSGSWSGASTAKNECYSLIESLQVSISLAIEKIVYLEYMDEQGNQDMMQLSCDNYPTALLKQNWWHTVNGATDH